MDFGVIVEFSGGIVLKEVRNCELAHIFECGQCFRWERRTNGNYIGIAYGKVIEVEKRGPDLRIYNTSKAEFETTWFEYFDWARDYDSVKTELGRDLLLKKAIDFGYGIRILKQEPFEAVLSFIISANNQIPRIKKIIGNISAKWGNPVSYQGNTYYTFPTVEALEKATIGDFEAIGAGYRARYLQDTVQAILTKQCRLEHLKTLEPSLCHRELQKLSGIGAKVADCIMLFSLGKESAFPVDVWVKKAMRHFYLAPDVSLNKIRDFAQGNFGELAGFAQQYLFYYARENHIKLPG